MIISLGIDETGRLAVKTRSETGGEPKLIGSAANRAELLELWRKAGIDEEKDTVICSSALDFPHESTKIPEVIELCDLLRRGS